MQPYEIKRAHQKNVQGGLLRDIASEFFGQALELEGKVVCRFGALTQLTAWTVGKVLYVNTT